MDIVQITGSFLVGGSLVYLLFGAVTNNPTVNTFEFAFWCSSVQLYAWDGITWPEGLHMFSFSRYCPTVLQNDCHIYLCSCYQCENSGYSVFLHALDVITF